MARWQDQKQTTLINALVMAWVEMKPVESAETTLLFLHGNPTSSYLWRNIMRPLSDRYRCLAPDLIGMGDSAKLPNSHEESYSFIEHRQYLDELLDHILPDQPVTLVVHDWGSALGFDWAHRNPERVEGIAYMEGIVKSMEWDEWNSDARAVFEGFRSENGEDMVLNKNIFVERVLPGSILRTLEDEEMAEYRRPFEQAGESRRPTLSWPRQIPLGGQPEEVVAIVKQYAAWMAANDLPKLFINAEPGAILTGATRESCRRWKNQQEVTVAGSHFIQEDSPAEIADAIQGWIATRSKS